MSRGQKISRKNIEYSLRKTGGNISATARNLHVHRNTIDRRVAQDPELKALTESERSGLVDCAEQGLRELIYSDNPFVRFNAIKYVLSTLGKSRGYTEKPEQESEGMAIIVRQKDLRL